MSWRIKGCRCLWRRRRTPSVEELDRALDDEELKRALRHNAASARLVRIRAGMSARVLRRLNVLLALRAKALEGIAAADAALQFLEKAKRHDEK